MSFILLGTAITQIVTLHAWIYIWSFLGVLPLCIIPAYRHRLSPFAVSRNYTSTSDFDY